MRVLLVIYDNGDFVGWFPQGLAYIAAVLRQEDIDVEIYHQDIHHYPDDHLKYHLDNNPKYDAVAISVIGGYWQYQRLCGLSKSINTSKKRPDLYLIGGYGPAPEPEYFLRQSGADIAVMGEGEITAREIFKKYKNNELDLNNVQGIAFMDGDKVKINCPRPLINEKDLDSPDVNPMPAYDLFPMDYYRMLRMSACDRHDFCLPILSGRGCTFKCNFCYRMDKGFRARSGEAIVEEMKRFIKDYRITYFVFSDDLLMVSKQRTVELMELFIKENLNVNGKQVKFNCNGRLNYATPDILKLMKKAGAKYINYGIEAYDNQILNNMKKGLNTNMIDNGIKETLKLGITPGLNIIWGNIGENLETLRKGVDFLKKHNDGVEMRTIRPVTPYPGSPLYYHAINNGLIDKKNPAEDFYKNKHLNSDLLAVNFTDLSDDDFHGALCTANKELVDDFFTKNAKYTKEQTEKLYSQKDKDFRGFRRR